MPKCQVVPSKSLEPMSRTLRSLPGASFHVVTFVLGLLARKLNNVAQRGRKVHARPGLPHGLPLNALIRASIFPIFP